MTRAATIPAIAIAVASVLVAMSMTAGPALAQDDEPTTFGAPEAPAAAPADGDYKGMLTVCDQRLETCETDAVGVPFLAAAYIALWVILLGFLLVVRSGQRRLEGELADLRDRLDGLPGSRA